ncbi:MAG TPA: hypothetical protein VLA96_02755 [Terriglobales bacterium]|nr:hypothetical protein [Terriglobales bacterium]
MRRLACAIILLSVVFVWGCGGGSNTNTGPVTSGLTRRAFVSNQFTGALDIINATDDIVSAHRIGTDPGPTIMSLSPDKSIILVATGTGSGSRIDAIGTASEAVLGSLSLPDESISFFYQPDSKIVFVAVRNSGQVFRWDTSTATNSVTSVSIPNARRMVRSPDGKHILVFPEDSTDTVWYIDTTASTLTPVRVGGAPGLFDRPVWAVFSSDSSKAWVLNCGPECGGASAGVQVLTFPGAVMGAAAGVPGGATYALLSGNTLYVAGTAPATPCAAPNTSLRCGALTKVDVSGALNPSYPPTAEISDGYHDHMLLAANNRLYIGAEFTCAAVAPNGCLSIFNTSSSAVVIVPPCGSACNSLNDISGMTTITGRNVVYVVEGGELRIYDSATDALQSKQVDTVGRSWDVISPD